MEDQDSLMAKVGVSGILLKRDYNLLYKMNVLLFISESQVDEYSRSCTFELTDDVHNIAWIHEELYNGEFLIVSRKGMEDQKIKFAVRKAKKGSKVDKQENE